MNIHCKLKAFRILLLLLSSQHASGVAIHSLKGSAVEDTLQSSDERPRQIPSPLQKHMRRHEPRGSDPISLHAFNRVLIWAWVVISCSPLYTASAHTSTAYCRLCNVADEATVTSGLCLQ